VGAPVDVSRLLRAASWGRETQASDTRQQRRSRQSSRLFFDSVREYVSFIFLKAFQIIYRLPERETSSSVSVFC
jgi:hypothetical protein